MPLEISFELSDADLEHFWKVMVASREKASGLDAETIIENARKLHFEVWHADTSDFIRERMSSLETMIAMLVDKNWALEDEDRKRVIEALAYFSEAEDLIPDDIPGLGFLDDAIMIEMVTQELKHEIQAFSEFCIYRASEAGRRGEEVHKLERSDWLEERRRQLHSRMRHRRNRSGRSSSGGSSPFSLF